MPPKGGNAKKESGRAKKAENEANKRAAAAEAEERKEAAQWADGAKEKNKKATAKDDKRATDLARKAENARLLEAEEVSGSSKVSKAPKAGAKKATPKPAGPGAIAAGSGLKKDNAPPAEPESFSATGLDDAIDLMEVVTSKMDKASIGQQAAGLEQHPERRFKAAFEAYKERELPDLKLEHPGLRLQQYNELLYKKFQKSPDNPFNQVTIAHNASKEEKVEALSKKRKEVEHRLRERS